MVRFGKGARHLLKSQMASKHYVKGHQYQEDIRLFTDFVHTFIIIHISFTYLVTRLTFYDGS